MTVRYLFLFLFLISLSSFSIGQQTDIPLNAPEYVDLDKVDIGGQVNLHSAIKPISRNLFSDAVKSTLLTDQEKLTFLLETQGYRDTLISQEGVFKALYKNQSDFFSHNSEDVDFYLNPVWAFGAGKERNSGEIPFQNYRGLELRGTIDNKVSFYSLLTENQARYPTYVRNVTDSTLGVPYEGFWKQYEVSGVDFLRAQGYVDFNVSKHIRSQFGFGKHFVGDGRRSLILSDFSNNYPYLRIQTELGQVQYTNIFAQLTGETKGGTFGLSGIGSFSRKYLAMHHLDVRIGKKLNIGFFESIIFGKPDSLGTNGWRVEYLNPVIFYRAVEQQDGSSDNALIGMDFKWNAFGKVSLYGQLLIDELVVSEVLSNSDWWGNKQGFQLGVKYPRALSLKNLYLQAEYNRVRPYVYAHESSYTSYSHYNMPLAHPLGANFHELLLTGEYQVTKKLTAYGNLLIAQYGNDRDSLSYGRDILKSYNLKTGEYDVAFLQGNKTSLFLVQTRLSYQWYHQLFTEVEFMMRKENGPFVNSDFTTTLISFTLRYYFPYRSYLF